MLFCAAPPDTLQTQETYNMAKSKRRPAFNFIVLNCDAKTMSMVWHSAKIAAFAPSSNSMVESAARRGIAKSPADSGIDLGLAKMRWCASMASVPSISSRRAGDRRNVVARLSPVRGEGGRRRGRAAISCAEASAARPPAKSPSDYVRYIFSLQSSAAEESSSSSHRAASRREPREWRSPVIGRAPNVFAPMAATSA